MSEQRDRAELDDVAFLGRTAEIFSEEVGQHYFGMVGGDLQAVDFGQRAERRGPRHEEIAEQPGVG